MGGGALLFDPNPGIRFRAHPTCSLRTMTGHSCCFTYRRDASQRCLAIKSEANKGAQARRNSKSNSLPSSKLTSESTTKETCSRRGDLSLLLKKIDESIKQSSAVAEPKEISMGEQKKQFSESPKKSSAVADLKEICAGEQLKRSMESAKKSSVVTEPKEISMGEQKKLSSIKKSSAVAEPKEISIGEQKKLSSIKKSSAVAEPKEISIVEQKKQALEPESKEEKLINGQKKSTVHPVFDRLRRDDGKKTNASPHVTLKSSGYEETFNILMRDDGNKPFALPRFDIKSSRRHLKFINRLKRDNVGKAVALPSFDLKSPGPSSNFDKLIRDNSNAIALPPDYKPPRPTSRFFRRSPIPISDPAEEEANTIPKKQPPSLIREPVKREMSVSDELHAIVGKKQSPPKSEQTGNLNLGEILKLNRTPKYKEIPKALRELKPKLEVEATTKLKPKLEVEATAIPELSDIPKAEPESVLNSELEAMTAKQLKSIAKARGLKGYTKLTKAGLLEILKETST